MTRRLSVAPDFALHARELVSGRGGSDFTLVETSDAPARLAEGNAEAAWVPATAVSDPIPTGLRVAAVPARWEFRDVFVPAGGVAGGLGTLTSGAQVGVAGRLRRSLLGLHRPDAVAVAVQNGRTPDQLLREGSVDAVILSAVDARVMGLLADASEMLEPKSWMPAPGQGTFLVLVRADDPGAERALARLDDPGARAALTAERRVRREFGTAPEGALGVLAVPYGRWVRVSALLVDADAGQAVRAELSGASDDPESVGARVAELLRLRGAGLVQI